MDGVRERGSGGKGGNDKRMEGGGGGESILF